jgi:hypothetical protein
MIEKQYKVDVRTFAIVIMLNVVYAKTWRSQKFHVQPKRSYHRKDPQWEQPDESCHAAKDRPPTSQKHS